MAADTTAVHATRASTRLRSRATNAPTCSWPSNSTSTRLRTEMKSEARSRRSAIGVALLVATWGIWGAGVLAAQEPASPQATSAAQLQAAIDKLGSLDYDTRTGASRLVRRTAASQAVPALLNAVAQHADGYVRYRALVLLTGFNDPRTRDAMRESLASPNDRLRTVAYSFFEHNPNPEVLAPLLAALDKEQGEFVRPALVRALAALVAVDADPGVIGAR